MIKNKTFMLFITAFILNFCLSNLSFAIENTAIKNRYPDYAYEFVGKDTFEKFNRKIFVFNSKLNRYVIRPVNIVWASVMPKYGMERVQSVYTNLEFPIRFTSCLLQKDFKSSKQEATRFLINTTLGVGGLYNPAKTRFKIEPRDEDMKQVLAYYKTKKGPYLVLPVILPGNIRDLIGELLDYPLNPTSYVMGPVAMAIKGVSLLNGSAYMQTIVKAIDYTYADPYDITKKLCGIEKYIKNSNLDRKEVLAQKTASQNIIEISDVSDNVSLKTEPKTDLKSDINLNNYNPQGPLVDSMRTALFDDKTISDSKWSELSVWNKSFGKQVKTSSVNIDSKHQNYKYRYILQKNKSAPLAIIYPSIGEGIMSHHSVVLAKLFYDEGYSVMIQGSAFQWEFVKSMPDSYKPGYPDQDASYSRLVTSKILSDLQSKKACKFDKKILVGTSFGALTTLFVAAKEEETNTLGISNYISISPPVEILFALKQLDKYSQNWKNDPSDIKLRAAIIAEKVVQMSQNASDTKTKDVAKNTDKAIAEDVATNKPTSLPFTNNEAELVIGFVMKQKLSDLVFTIENSSQNTSKHPTSKKNELYKTINEMSYYDYAEKYLLIGQYQSEEQLRYDTSLYCLADFLQKNEKYKIYHAIDDYYANPEQLIWLKKQSNHKSVFFNNGSHLGFLYRKEFLDELKKDIKPQNAVPKEGV